MVGSTFRLHKNRLSCWLENVKFVVEQFCILIVVVNTQIYACDKTVRAHRDIQTHTRVHIKLLKSEQQFYLIASQDPDSTWVLGFEGSQRGP